MVGTGRTSCRPSWSRTRGRTTRRRSTGGTGTTAARRSSTRGAKRRRRSRGRPPSRRRRSGSATRRARRPIPTRLRRACDRQQRRSPRRPPRSHGARLPGGRLGRHHPALRVPGQGRQAPDLPGLQLERGRAGDLRERLRAAHAADAQEGGPHPRMRRTARRRQVPRPLGLREQERHHRRADGRRRTRSRPLPADRGQPTAFAAGRVEDAFQVEFNGSELTWSLTGNKESASIGLDRSAPAARSRSRSGSSPRATPAASRCGSTARSAAAPRPSATAGRRERSQSRRAAAR